MSYSSIYLMDKDFNGVADKDFSNSWLFSPICWDVLFWNNMPDRCLDIYGFKRDFLTAIMFDEDVDDKLNNTINESENQTDRIIWELTNQQVLFSKDKNFIVDQINIFYEVYSKLYEEINKENYFNRFIEISSYIRNIDENKYPYFIFKNSSCDDNVEYWFENYDEENDEYVTRPLSKVDKYVTEFVFIKDNKIEKFVNNLQYFNGVMG